MELLVVLAIIAILATIAVPRYEAAVRTAKIVKAIAELREISREVDMYMLANGKYPDSLEEIGARRMRDPWGNPYIFVKLEEGGAGRGGSAPSAKKGKGGWKGGRTSVKAMAVEKALTVKELKALVKKEKIIRRDRGLFPLNSDYDLYSLGADRATNPMVNARVSLDDVIRANNGRFFGLAGDY